MTTPEISDRDALAHILRGDLEDEDGPVDEAELKKLLDTAIVDRLERDHNAIHFEVRFPRGTDEGLLMGEMIWDAGKAGWYRFYDGHCYEKDAEDAFVEEAEDGTYRIDWGE